MNPFDDLERLPMRDMQRENEIGNRTRFHANTLGARVFLADGKVLLVRGTPDQETLCKRLVSDFFSPLPSLEGLSPAQLGFANSDITPLSRGSLTSRARSVQKWRHWAEARLTGKSSDIDHEILREELQLLEKLGRRVTSLYVIINNPGPADSPLRLEPDQEKELADWFEIKLAGLHVPDEVALLARLVCWLKGTDDVDRFLSTLRDGLIPLAIFRQHEALRHFTRYANELHDLYREYETGIKQRNEKRTEEIQASLRSQNIHERLGEAARLLRSFSDFRNRSLVPAAGTEIDFGKLQVKCRNLMAHYAEPLPGAENETAQGGIRRAIGKFESVVNEALSLISRVHARLGGEEKTDLARFRTTLREEGRYAELRNRYERLPEVFKGSDRIQLPGRDSEIDFGKIRTIADKLSAQTFDDLPKPFQIRSIALFCMTGAMPVPMAWSTAIRHFDHFYDFETFWKLRNCPGYERLLESLEVLKEIPNVTSAMMCLQGDGTAEDLMWFADKSYYRLPNLCTISGTKAFRTIHSWMEKHDPEFDNSNIVRFGNAIVDDAGVSVANSLARFLDWLSRPNGQQVGEIRGLIQILSHPSFRQPMIDRLRSWTNPPSRPRLPANCPRDLPAAITTPLRRLAFYQRLAGQPARIPGSITSKLEANTRRIAEIRHLESLGENCNASQSQRLAYLSQRVKLHEDKNDTVNAALLRQVQEVTVLTALMAVKNLFRDEIKNWWRQQFDSEPDFSAFRWMDLYSLFLWADELSATEHDLVTAIMKAHRRHGPRYRHAMPTNAAWLEEAARKIDLEAWASPEPIQFMADDHMQVILKAATNPIDIFLMGSRFDTCLRVDGGVNSRSVIANAADANKAVIYAFRKDGTPIARKLIGITSDWNLIGYRLYAQEKPDSLKIAFESYCGTLAAKAGLGLSSKFAPRTLSGGFWYDDGAVEWSEQAVAAYRGVRPDLILQTDFDEKSKLERLHQALRLTGIQRAAALGEVARIDKNYWCFASMWMTISGFDPCDWLNSEAIPNRPYPSESCVIQLLAADLTSKLKDPKRFGYVDEYEIGDYWQTMMEECFYFARPDRKSLAAVIELVLQIDLVIAQPYFMIENPYMLTPALATFPFSKLLKFLRKLTCCYDFRNFEKSFEYWKPWVPILATAWKRRPDASALAEAFKDPSDIMRQVVRQFCLDYPDRRFAASFRRAMRATTDETRLNELRAIQQRILALPAETPGNSPELAAIDPDLPLAVRTLAVMQLIRESFDRLPELATRICTVWTKAERAALPVDARLAIARSLWPDPDGEELQTWRIWPLHYWQATLPEHERDSLVHEMMSGHRSTFNSMRLGDVELPGRFVAWDWVITLHALRHQDSEVRQSAESVIRMTARLAPEKNDILPLLFGPMIDPETVDRIKPILAEEATRANGIEPAD